MQGLVPTSDQLEEMGREKTKVCVNNKKLTPKIIFQWQKPCYSDTRVIVTYTQKKRKWSTRTFKDTLTFMVIEMNFSSEVGTFSPQTEEPSNYCYKPKKFCVHIWTHRVKNAMTMNHLCALVVL